MALASRFPTELIEGPFFAALLLLLAFAVSAFLVRSVPAIGRTLMHVESNRQTSIDGLRGFLGVSVFVHHTVITWFLLHGAGWQLPPSRLIVHLGQTSVALFFMITAFLFWGRVLDRGSRIDWAEFLVSRLFRLYPVYLLMVALLLAGVVAQTMSARHQMSGPIVRPLVDWLLFTLFGTPDVNGVTGTSMVVAGVTWTLQYEWLFYLALPLIGFLTGRSRKPVAAIASTAAVAVIFWQDHGVNPFAARILLSFAGGIIAAHLVRTASLGRLGRTTPAGLVAVGALAAVISLLPTAYTWQATVGLTVFFVVIALGNDLWGLLRLRGLLWLGDITYSIYLLHGFLLWLVFQWFLPRPLASRATVFLGSAIVIDVTLVLVSSAVFLTIERPAILLGKRLLRRPARYPVTIAQPP